MPGPDAGPVVVFGGYAAIVAVVLALASTGSGVAMVAVGLILAGLVAIAVWWCGVPVTDPPAAGTSTVANERRTSEESR